MSSSRRSSGKTAPPRPKMIGTVLPHDSMRGIRNRKPTEKLTTLPPPPPTTTRDGNVKLLAAAGRDLFRQGLAFDGVLPMRQEPRHPAVTPNLVSIPENATVRANGVSTQSQLIVVVGGPLNSRGEPGVWVSNRIAKAIQLYWQIRMAFAEFQEDQDEETPASLCYVAPTGGESADEGIIETEAIRNALVVTGVSPHHIIMDCTATSLVDNALQLVSIVRRLHVRTVHVVTSNFQVPRVKLCYDEIVRVASGLTDVQLVFHGAPDGLTATERAERAVIEQKLLVSTRAELTTAVQRRLDAKPKKTSSRSNLSANGSAPNRRPTYQSDV